MDPGTEMITEGQTLDRNAESVGAAITDRKRGYESAETEAERLEAIAELIQALSPRDVLLRWVRENRPPQSCYDDEEGDLL